MYVNRREVKTVYLLSKVYSQTVIIDLNKVLHVLKTMHSLTSSRQAELLRFGLVLMIYLKREKSLLKLTRRNTGIDDLIENKTDDWLYIAALHHS